MDLASHILVGESMVFPGKEGGGSERYTLGNGNGLSVREIVAHTWSWEQQHFHESGCSVVGE